MRRPIAWVGGGLLLLALLRWWPVLLGRAEFCAEDVNVINLPLRSYAGWWLRQGVLVLWTPLLQNGFPLFAESQAGLTYPLRALDALPLPDTVLLGWAVALHLAWAGAGLTAFLHLRGYRGVAALLPALAYGLSAHLVVRHQHTNVLEGLAWWPWLLAGVEATVGRRAAAPAVLLGLAGALLIACAHIQFAVYGLTLAAAWAAFRLGHGERAPGAGWRLLGALLLTAGYGAWQVLPLLELARQSLRSGGVWEQGYQILKPTHLPLLLAPNFWGPLFDPTCLRPAQRWEVVGCVGALPPLALLAVRGRQPAVRFWLAVAALGLLGAAGDRLGVSRLLALLPGWDSFRAPARLLSLTALAVPLLAAEGLAAVAAGPVRRPWRAVAAGVAAATLLALLLLPPWVGRVTPAALGSCRGALLLAGGSAGLAALWLHGLPAGGRWRLLAGVALVVGEALLVSLPLTPTRPCARPPLVDGRVAVGTGRDGALEPYRPFANLRRGVANVWNVSPLTLREPVELLTLADQQRGGARARLLALQGVRNQQSDDQTQIVAARHAAAPDCWRVARQWIEPDRERARRMLLDPTFDPAATALVRRRLELQPAVPAVGTVDQPTPNRQVYTVSGRGLWVLNTTPYAGMAVYVNGVRQPAEVVNLLQTGVVCAAEGEQRIVVIRSGTCLRLGRFLALLAIAAGLGWGLGARRA
ncbi:MAG: hypothetical protein IT204_01300 [Fimbriimonadaceae bacterium]|nr:hypothetical protein [Fimbriimonadaceae bacterium]